MQLVEGPTWTTAGLTYAAGLYPLRVETHMRRLLGSLLPGVITTTTQARMYSLHALAWAEARARGLDLTASQDLLRRCEVIVCAASLCHEDHRPGLPAPHGADAIAPHLGEATLDLDELSRPGEGQYAKYAAGFGGTYRGSEAAVKLLGSGRQPPPGVRFDDRAARTALGDVLELAGKRFVSMEEVRAAQHLCICAAPSAPDGPWLWRTLFAGGVEDWDAHDEARQSSARLLLETIASGDHVTDVPGAARRTVGFGGPADAGRDGRYGTIAQGWRGAILRNYSVGAWRRLWSWLVAQLSEPMTAQELGELLAAELPAASLADAIDDLPATTDEGLLLPAEEAVRSESWSPNPWTEFRLLALGALRLDHLEGRELTAFAGAVNLDDLGPHWVKRRLSADPSESLQDLARDWAEMLLRRAQRVALSKMEMHPTGPWLPTRIRERDGLFFRRGDEGYADVALRLDTLLDVLCGVGAVARTEDRDWCVTELGETLLG